MADEAVTTLVLRALPRSFDEAKVTQELQSMGLGNVVDFVYVPTIQMTLAHAQSLGFAIVNFVDAAAAEYARQIIVATKIQVGTAPLQGPAYA